MSTVVNKTYTIQWSNVQKNADGSKKLNAMLAEQTAPVNGVVMVMPGFTISIDNPTAEDEAAWDPMVSNVSGAFSVVSKPQATSSSSSSSTPSAATAPSQPSSTDAQTSATPASQS